MSSRLEECWQARTVWTLAAFQGWPGLTWALLRPKRSAHCRAVPNSSETRRW